MKRQTTKSRLAICINDGGYIDDLKVRTVYRVLPDESAAKSNYLRIVDETGEDYLYPAAYFVLVDLPREIEKALPFEHYPTAVAKQVRKKSVAKHKAYAWRKDIFSVWGVKQSIGNLYVKIFKNANQKK